VTVLLVIDIGNTNTSFGVVDLARRALVEHVRTESARSRTSDEYAVLVRGMLELKGIEPRRISHAIVASVVPALTDRITRAVQTAFGVDCLVVGPGIKTQMPILYEDPREVGADRIVNAVAAFEWVATLPRATGAAPGVIVVDFGTATTFDCVTPKGEYLGGVITPGIEISAEALFARAARLRRVELAAPPKVVGRNAQTSMQSGIVYGYAGLVDGLVARLRRELGYPCHVVATGGLAKLIAPFTESIEEVDDALTLTGLLLLWERNAPPSA
jgi:type III pantothenate kinase